MMVPSMVHKVFVYGTLKRGEPNHEWFSKDKTGYYKFLFQAETMQKFPLIIATNFNIPFLLHNPGVGHNVIGEVYEVDDKVMANLDILEDHPNFYVREQNEVRPLDESQSTDVWVYFIKQFKPELLQREMFKSYSNDGDHGLRYVTRYLRDPSYKVKIDVLIDP